MVIHICLTCPNIAFHTVLDDIYQERQRDSSLLREVSDKMVCLACRCTFTNREDQVFPGFVLNPFLNAVHGSWHRHLGHNYFLWYVRWNTTSLIGIVSIWNKRCWERRQSQSKSLRRRLERVRKSSILHIYGGFSRKAVKGCLRWVVWLQETCQVSQDRSLIPRKVLTATTSLRQIMRLHLKAVKVQAGPPPRSFSRTQQDSICQCIAASCRASLLRYEYSTVPSVPTELYLIFFCCS